MNIPPPIPQTNVETAQTVCTEVNSTPNLHALHLFVTATEAGDVAQVRLESNVIAAGRLTPTTVAGIGRRIAPLFASGNVLYDRVQIEVDRNLRYEELLKLVDVCAQQKLPDGKPLGKVSFVEMQR